MDALLATLLHNGRTKVVLAPLLAATLLVGGCDDPGPMPDPVFAQSFESEAEVFEGQPAHFTIAVDGANGYTVRRSDDGGYVYADQVATMALPDGPIRTQYTTPPVDYERDRQALFVVDAYNREPSGKRAPGAVRQGPVVIQHIVRSSGFDSQPNDVVGGIGGTVRLQVQAHGEGLSYQWQRSDDGGSNWAALPGATDATVQIDSVQAGDDGALFRVQLAGRNGSATSRSARLGISRQPPVQFHDEDFADADWLIETLLSGSGGIASAQLGLGDGNPGRWRLNVVWVHDAKADAPAAVYMLNWRRGAVYTPAVDGAIVSVDYSEDQRHAATSAEQSSALIARQAGHLYYAAATGTPETRWTRKPRSALVAADFTLLSGADPQRAIDFSATGGPIEFGYLRANNIGAGGAQLITTADIDNWSVTVWR